MNLEEKLQMLRKKNVCEYWFENLNFREEYKSSIFSYINTHYSDLKEKYEIIYLEKDSTYWNTLANLLNTYCDELGLNISIIFIMSLYCYTLITLQLCF